MIEAAEALFLDQGYDATSLAAVVKKSGGSLATLYELFGNKQGLLRAIIDLRNEEDRCPSLDDAGADASPSEMLRDYAQRLCSHVTSPRAVALKRIVITEALRDPDFARSLYEDIHLPSIRDFAATLQQLNDRGQAEVDDPLAAAQLFFAIVMSDSQMRALVAGGADALDAASLDWRLRPFLSHFRIR